MFGPFYNTMYYECLILITGTFQCLIRWWKVQLGNPFNFSTSLFMLHFWQFLCYFLFCVFRFKLRHDTGLGGSVGCAVRLETRRSRVQPPPMSATFFHGDWSWNIFYSHSLPSADSRRAVVSFWRKNVHNTGKPLRGLNLPSKCVVR